MRAVVIGGSGQIGGWLLRHLHDRGHEAVGTYRSVAYPGLVPLSATGSDDLAPFLEQHRPEVVFYPAGFTWVDGCERDPAKARQENCEGPLNLARLAARQGSRFVYFSTDYVFDGTAGPNREDDPTCPLNVYGQAKVEAEQQLAAELGDRLITIRTSWVYGPERQGKNFGYQVCRRLVSGQPVTVPSDQRSNPSYGPDIARTAIVLVEQGYSGLVHGVGPEVIDRVQFARTIAEGFDLSTEAISGKPTAELSQGAPRPLQGGLTWDRLESLIPGAIRPSVEAVADFRAICEQDSTLAQPLEVPTT